MKRHFIYSTAFACLVFLGAASHVMAHGKKDNEADIAAVRAVIVEMNAAVSKRDLDGLLATFAPGAVRVDLFAAHKYADKTAETKPNHAVSSADLGQRWRGVAPVLFAAMKEYQREASHILVRVDGDMAVAWARIDTKSVANNPEQGTGSNHFREAMLLKKIDGAWKIATMTNNRHD